MRTVPLKKPFNRTTITGPVKAVVVQSIDGPDFYNALDLTGLGSLLDTPCPDNAQRPSVAIVTDAAIPNILFSYCAAHKAGRTIVASLTRQRILPENSRYEVADATDRTNVSPGFALCGPWARCDIRIVVSRVKTDRRGAYSLCCAALSACMFEGGIDTLLDRFPAHCAVIAGPVRDTPAIVSGHPLLADWVGATLMGRDPFSAPDCAEWLRKGLLPRTFRIFGNTSPIPSWRSPPSMVNSGPSNSSHDGATAGFFGENAALWSAYVQSVMAPFLASAGKETFRGVPAREALVKRIASAMSPESMGEILEALLKGLGLFIGFHPELTEDIRSLRAGYLFATADRRMSVAAEFTEGGLKAGRTASVPINVTLVFKDPCAMLDLFASPKPDLLRAMLKQQIAFEGNLNYLLKFAYLLRRVLLAAKGGLGVAS